MNEKYSKSEYFFFYYWSILKSVLHCYAFINNLLTLDQFSKSNLIKKKKKTNSVVIYIFFYWHSLG